MGKDLHYTIISFFRDRMAEHSQFEEYSLVKDDDEILYKVVRPNNLPDLIVHLSDSYIYRLHDFYSKPPMLSDGDFILIARPEAKYTAEVQRLAVQNKIGIGKLGEFLGALHKRDTWTYSKDS